MIIYLQMIETAEDKEKFEQIYDQYKNLMFYIAQGHLHDQYDAEDAVHQAFLSIVVNIKRISQVLCPETKAFVVIVTERKAIDILRKRTDNISLDDDNNDIPIEGIDIPIPGDGGLADALARLPANYRSLIILRFANGYSTRELARIFEKSQSAVQRQLWRAKEALRKELEKGGNPL